MCWRLLTTLPVATLAEAKEVAHLYRLRWRIEQLFRTFKTAGLDIEASQVWEAARMLKLAALGLVAAARIMQLVDARDGSSRPASDVIEASDVAAVAAISRSLEGGTARQRNPHPQGSLAFLSWVTARLGGWTGYYRPPGPKTMATGQPPHKGEAEEKRDLSEDRTSARTAHHTLAAAHHRDFFWIRSNVCRGPNQLGYRETRVGARSAPASPLWLPYSHICSASFGLLVSMRQNDLRW